MLAKFGFILLILLFGALAFTGGLLAPPDWRADASALGDRLLSRKGAIGVHTAPATTASAGKPASASTAAPPVSSSALLVTADVGSPAPAAGQPAYALQLGQFVTDDEAAAAEQQAQRLGLPLTRLKVTDADKTTWTVVAAGRFVSADAAQDAAARVQALLKLASTPVIKLPAPAKSAAA